VGLVKEVFFPLDEQLELWEQRWSEGLAKEAVWLSGVVDSYAEAGEVMRRVGHVEMSTSTIWRRVEKWGRQFEQRSQECREQAAWVPKRGELITPLARRAHKQMGLAMDGGMVHIRQEGWKELKAGCVYDIEQRASFDKETQEWLELGHAVNNSYVAHLGGPEIFGQLLWAEAKQRDWEAVYDTQVIGDGAPWIWNLTREHFFDSRQTVDWYHSTDHLHQAAQLCYPDDPLAQQRWYKAAETTLFQGHAETIASDLDHRATGRSQRDKDLRTQAGYFQNNKRRMQYLETREEGYPIGSGMIESGIKQFKARFTGPGMRWSRKGIQRLIPIRAAVLSRSFDQLWASVYNSPKN
jgi:hypothetical protein